jgi:uncharacterized protein
MLGTAMPAARLESLPRRFVGGHEVPVAVGFRARLLGLALLDRAVAGSGLLIPCCASIHTFGMRFALDIWFLDEDDEVLERLLVPPRRFAVHRGALSVLELPAQSQRSVISASASSAK